MADYIGRETLLEMLKVHEALYPIEPYDTDGYKDGWRNAVEEIIGDVENMEAADVRPERYGEWICKDFGVLHQYFCSECKCEMMAYGIKTRYCPYCGAKM
ncbi:MAG: hypothetical protein NC299_17270, partial [Lachnospiraceae bacterium]|nr:hypothetical protein [Ruminococcus sp.]MCM1277082.1 hypothetical protein [Lachnospiraceae bacterium]